MFQIICAKTVMNFVPEKKKKLRVLITAFHYGTAYGNRSTATMFCDNTCSYQIVILLWSSISFLRVPPPFDALFGYCRTFNIRTFGSCLDFDFSKPNMSSDDDDDEYRMYGQLLDPIQEGKCDRWNTLVLSGFLYTSSTCKSWTVLVNQSRHFIVFEVINYSHPNFHLRNLIFDKFLFYCYFIKES